MLTLSYRSAVRLLRTVPICPKPRRKGLENIPKNEPVIYVYNHIILRAEPVWLALGAPAKPVIRFFTDIKLADPTSFSILKRDIRESVFTQRFLQKTNRYRWTKAALERFVRGLAWFIIAQMNRFDVIIADLDYPTEKEAISRKFKTNYNALKKCVRCLDENIPIAIAPSGGKTYEGAENAILNTTVPTLASRFFIKGKVVKIVPCAVKERPPVDHSTYWRYVADRIIFYRIYRQALNLLKIKRYQRPDLTIEFLPPLTFEKAHPTKGEKMDFINNVLKSIYENLKK
jgi:1-acyl-sn-glycerol-3-phosphate acyltransferase